MSHQRIEKKKENIFDVVHSWGLQTIPREDLAFERKRKVHHHFGTICKGFNIYEQDFNSLLAFVKVL